eukprot:c1493_g1_i1.p2 GENE.c1493_g1_i1~~c1493_g1_i1.p2  ORF type:complete len:120 (-),score=26.99 c1493_g1_i1:217-576(-)
MMMMMSLLLFIVFIICGHIIFQLTIFVFPLQAEADNSFPLPKLEEFVAKYQDPHNADPLMKIMKDLDETKVILHKTIDSALERGQKLDELIDKSNDLSAMSKSFYKQSKDLNKCSCVIL